MKVQYSKDEDILMIELAQKKVDDSYETDHMIVHIDKDKEPVLLEIFNAKKLLKNIGQAIPKKLQQEVWPQSTPAVSHRIK